MKNFIKYYYNLDLEIYEEKSGNITFTVDKMHYVLTECNRNIEELMNTYNTLITHNIYCHEIVPNKDNFIITNYNNKNYILIKKYINDSNLLSLKTIKDYDINISVNKTVNWKLLWEQKLDYYEYQISELGAKYKKLKDSFSYYSGLCECAINLLNYVNYSNVRMNIAHIRINADMSVDEFLNPVNITIDNITRDIAEYLKSNTSDIIEFELTNDEYILLMARLIYPSYYFDTYDRIIKGDKDESEVETIIKKNNSFELFLVKTYKYLSMKSNIPKIDWLHDSNYF